ncbi:putative methyltransferase-domain-containing protein [Ochromonadaceae sp. CCMP2298]|nr:putative methyltransferase-domain-containing protein [Ochromonadaceae sp. CCMP2298]
MNNEVLECARYGEDEDLRALLKAGASVDHLDESRSSAMHKAAANGEVACLKVLHEFGAQYVKNNTGNSPAHWAAQNGKAEALKFLIESYKDIDVLDKNDLGRSVLTEAFQSKSTECIELCLSHDSATEERLLPQGSQTKTTNSQGEETINVKVSADEGDGGMEVEEAGEMDVDAADSDAVTHSMGFAYGLAAGEDPSAASVRVQVRELPITRADSPFGSTAAPEDDTTGLSVWPAAILLSHWVAQWGTSGGGDLAGKVVLELGAGCGLPGIVAALACRPKTVYITDIHEPTLRNAAHNVLLNNCSYAGGAQVQVSCVNWLDPTSFPPQQADVILGSDLVYDADILGCLIPAICAVLSPDGSLLYCAPDTGRLGMQQLQEALARAGIECVERFPAPAAFYRNPLLEADSDQFVLHFYDLSAGQPHTLYRFCWNAQLREQHRMRVAETGGSGAVEMSEA